MDNLTLIGCNTAASNGQELASVYRNSTFNSRTLEFLTLISRPNFHVRHLTVVVTQSKAVQSVRQVHKSPNGALIPGTIRSRQIGDKYESPDLVAAVPPHFSLLFNLRLWPTSKLCSRQKAPEGLAAEICTLRCRLESRQILQYTRIDPRNGGSPPLDEAEFKH